MTPSKFMPCDDWSEKLSMPENDLSASDRAELEEHVASCPHCVYARIDDRMISALIRYLPAPDFPAGLPLHLLQALQDEGSNGNSLETLHKDTESILTPSSEDATSKIDLQNDATWDGLYRLLIPMVRNWVYHAQVPAWSGQELDVAWDIVQTALRKTFEYAMSAQEHSIAIASLERLGIVIAKNQLRDQRRKDNRRLHLERNADSPEAEASIFYAEDHTADEDNLARLYEEWIFGEVAEEVMRFPEKMRLAVLIDLATRLEARGEFCGDPSPLLQAFIDEGVHLKAFVGLLPADPVARARHSSLISLGYKRIAKVVSVDQSSRINVSMRNDKSGENSQLEGGNPAVEWIDDMLRDLISPYATPPGGP